MSFTVVIPARYASTRLPGKPLLDIAGEPMIAHVWRRALASGASAVVIATDDERIAEAARGFGAEVCMTSPAHPSGTDRLAEAVRRLGLAPEAIVVNVQGDEPLIPPALVRQAARALDAHPEAAIATLCEAITDPAGLFDPNVVKVVRDAAGFALYFSRAPVPWYRDAFARSREVLPDDALHRRHIGIYAYRVGFLERYVGWPAAPLEQAEALEQLRALHNGERIFVADACERLGPGIDTPADLERVRGLLASAGPTR